MLNSLEGAYDQALYHAKRAIQIDENNTEYKEYYLLFYKQPNLNISVSNEEFIKCCDDLLKLDENNETAKSLKMQL